MSKKIEGKQEKQEKETSMRFDRDWSQPLGKRGIVKLIAKKVKSLPLLLTQKEQEDHDRRMAPKRMRRQQHREAKRLEAKMTLNQTKVQDNAVAA